MVDAPLNAYLRVPPPSDPESQQGHLDGELTKIERTTRETLTRLGTLATTYAPIADPTFTGNPTAPTPASSDNDTSLATTAFVKVQDYATNTALTTGLGTAATNLTTGLATKAAVVHTHAQSDVTGLVTTLASLAPLASPTLTGTPTAPTATAGTNTTQLATTAFVAATTSTVVVNTSDQSLASNISFTNVPDLKFPMVANGKYIFRAILFVSTGAGGCKFAVTGPTGLVKLRAALPVGTFTTAYGATISSALVASVLTEVDIVGTVINGTTAGDLVIQFGQTTSNASPAIVQQDSWIEYRRIG